MVVPRQSSGQDSVSSIEDLLHQALSKSEIAILSAITKLIQSNKTPPIASEIGTELKKRHPLKRTQLYHRLKQLRKLGFLETRLLNRPLCYHVDKTTIMAGMKRWLEDQRESVRRKSEELDSLDKIFDNINHSVIYQALVNKT